MAFNFKSFLTRSLTAIVFVIVFMTSLLWRYELFSLFFLLISIIGVFEFMKISEKLGAQPIKPLVFISSISIYFVFVNWSYFNIHSLVFLNKQSVWLILLVPFVFLGAAVFSKSKSAFLDALHSIMAVFYATLPFCLLHNMAFTHEINNLQRTEFNPWFIFGLVLLIWSNDTFAYLGGSFFGKTKLIERVSPGKTIEGTLIGILLTFLLSYTLPLFIQTSPPISWQILGVLVPILATIGDLMESLLKRNAGIKDSGNLLPGHGGVLDRFDSLILVSPLLAIIVQFSQL